MLDIYSKHMDSYEEMDFEDFQEEQKSELVEKQTPEVKETEIKLPVRRGQRFPKKSREEFKAAPRLPSTLLS